LALSIRDDDAAGVHAARLIAQHHTEILCVCMHQHLPAKAYVIGIPASQFEFSEELSAQTDIAMYESVKLVDQMIFAV